MIPATTDGPSTARSFLFGDGEGGDTGRLLGEALHEQGVGRTALSSVRRLPASAAHLVDREIGTVADGLLDLDLGDALVLGWRRYSALVDAAERTLAAPDGAEIVALATHRITSTYRPHVDLMVGGVKLNTFEFELQIVFDLTGVSAVVRSGNLVAVRGGDCLVTARLFLEGLRLAERKKPVDVTREVRLVPGVPLVRKPAPPPALPQQRGGQPGSVQEAATSGGQS